jgi:folate-binding protein YgfZ
MAALSLTAPSRSTQSISNTWRESLHSLRSPRVVTARPLSTASSPKHAIRISSTPHPYRRNGAARTVNNATISRGPRQHQYSTTSTLWEREHRGDFAPLPHRRLVSLSGADAPKFLQGLITNNVDPLDEYRTSFYSAFLDARGRVLWDVFVWIIKKEGPWACLIEVDGSEVESLKKHLKRHKLRSKVQIEDVSETEIKVWAAWGISQIRVEHSSLIATLQDSRDPSENFQRYLAHGDAQNIATLHEPVHVREYHLWRYRQGVPEGPQEIPRESALPMEYNIDLSQGIDFNKGCYVGQELTIRTKHTGIVRKRILPITLSLVRPSPDAHPESTIPTVPPEHGADIKQLDSQGNLKKGRAAGKFIAGIGNVGLALCRLENMTSMKVSAEGGAWKEGMAFGCETEEGVVRLEPVLHEEFLGREQMLWGKKRGV